MPIITRTFTLEGDTMPLLLGAHDANLRELEKLLTSDIHVRGTEPVSYTHLTLPTKA